MAKAKIDYKKICWNCGSKTEDKGDYYQCPDCKATYTNLPDPGNPAVKLMSSPVKDNVLGGRWTPYKP